MKLLLIYCFKKRKAGLLDHIDVYSLFGWSDIMVQNSEMLGSIVKTILGPGCNLEIRETTKEVVAGGKMFSVLINKYMRERDKD